MKARRYDDILRARGYKPVERTKYQGVNLYKKVHKYNACFCQVIKDTHGKGQSIEITITSQISIDPDIKKEIELDAGYLQKEAHKIIEAFIKLKEMKSPKHIYF